MGTEIGLLIKKHEEKILTDWIVEQTATKSTKISLDELKANCKAFLNAVTPAMQSADQNINNPAWAPVKNILSEISRSRGLLGFSPSETANFVFSLKKPLFSLIRQEYGMNPQKLADETWTATLLFDNLGLFSTEAYQKTRDEIIVRQQEEMLELSTPVVKLWDGILALPMIGTLDSNRTQVVMESLLQKIMETNSEIAIIDITGVPTVDTLVAQHLIKTVTAAKLMGAECIISGIRPQIAATIVHLGVDLGGVATKSSLADAFALALGKMNKTVVKLSQVKA
jgi:Anti-anti-sigma regulatory factor (antagonist of anti-sigma factor)